jgi:hypothetical protein
MEATTLRCDCCGAIAERLQTARHPVRSLSRRRDIKEGDLLCDRCLQELQEELSEEEATRGPA